MKLYYFPIAPNPTRVRLFIREKGIEIEEVLVDLRKGQQQTPEHLARNPRGTLPVLELDNGDYIAESLPIMEYFEELQPEPVMIGSDPMARLKMREYERLVETEILNRLARIVHSTNSPLGLPPRPEISGPELERLPAAYRRIDERIGDNPFAAGQQPSIVDCTLFAGLQFGEFGGVQMPADYVNLRRWHAAFRARHSSLDG